MSPFVILLLPVYAFLKPRSILLEQFNKLVLLALYFPISVLLLLVFLILNLAFLPFGYFAAIISKALMIRRINHSERGALLADLVTFVIAGGLFLLLV